MQRGSALVTLGCLIAGIGGGLILAVLEREFRFSFVSAVALSMLGTLVIFIVYGVLVTIGERIEDKLPARRPRRATPFPGYRAWRLLAIALLVPFGVWLIVRWATTPDTPEWKARRYWAEI